MFDTSLRWLGFVSYVRGMRVAITGSSGLIGTALRKALAERGDDVVRVVRSNPGPNDIVWDIDAGTIDTAGLEGIDAIVHLAGEGIGEKKWSDEQKAKIYDSRIDGTTLLSNALAELTNKPSVYVCGSAMGIYGDRGDEKMTEDSAPGTGFLADLTIAWEAAAKPAVDAGIRTAFIRTGIVLSAEGGALKEQLPFFKLGIGGKIGNGKQYWSWITITDHVNAMLYIIDGDLSGPVNLAGPNPSTNAEFTKALGKALGRPTFLPTPRPAVELRLGKECAKALLYDSTRVIPHVLNESDFTFEHPTIEAALAAVL